MTIEYIVLGALLIIMGAAQVWLRHGQRFKPQGDTDEEKAKEWNPEEMPSRFAPTRRSSRGWSIWTSILGPIGVVFGIFLVVLGVLGK